MSDFFGMNLIADKPYQSNKRYKDNISLFCYENSRRKYTLKSLAKAYYFQYIFPCELISISKHLGCPLWTTRWCNILV